MGEGKLIEEQTINVANAASEGSKAQNLNESIDFYIFWWGSLSMYNLVDYHAWFGGGVRVAF